jgi:hypothetical protein
VKDRELMQMALDALDTLVPQRGGDIYSRAAQALRDRLAQPEREWVGLNDDEIKEIIGPWGPTPIKGYTRKLFDAIETKLKEKNT